MFIVSNKEMIVAAANAGILGAMPSLNARTPEGFEQDLEWIRARTDKPFAINLTIGLTAPARLARDVELCFQYEVPVLLTSYGDPTRIVQEARARNVTVFHDVIQLQHARKAVSAGVDGIIAVSHGAGGHAGRVNPFVLVPWLGAELGVPIIAAGCITGGKQVAAALALGAELAYIGTRFIASEECGADRAYKQLIIDSTHDNIVYTDKVSGIHANFLEQTLPKDNAAERTPEGAKKWRDIWSAGQGVTLIHEVQPMEVIVEQIVREFHDATACFR
jgi:nitronate monooxygenase